jgi:hypothetical protein
MAKEQISKDEQIGFHKGALNTLAKERQEFTKIIGIVDSLLKAHIQALKELGVDITKAAPENPSEGLEKSIKSE